MTLHFLFTSAQLDYFGYAIMTFLFIGIAAEFIFESDAKTIDLID